MEPARKFKIIVNSKECGTCSGPTPSAVAKKVVKKLCGNSSKTVKFSLKECKRGCERVCGPYQGRMEKLDRHCKRDGKTITHRVVCGKVRKMRGGALGVQDFRKRDGDGDFKFDKIGLRPHIFFGQVEVNEVLYYKYVIFNIDHFDRPFRKSKKVGIKDIDLKDTDTGDIGENLILLLKSKIGRTNEDKYKSIKLFLGINKVNEGRRENGSEGNESKEREKAIKELRKYYKHIHLMNTKFITDDLVSSLKRQGVNLSRNILIKLINQEQEFIQTQIQKSINKHMQSNNINISNVYNNIPENEETYYKRFFEEGKRKANFLKTEEPKINNRNNN